MTRALLPPGLLARLVLGALPAVATTVPANAQGGVSLRDVPALAKGRAERQRPVLEQKLAPYWRDLARNPVEERKTVEQKIAEVAALGDKIVPLLLEKLEPAQGTPEDRYLARNCAEVLARLEPKNFTEALVDIATGKGYTAQGHAITLLGLTESPQAGKVLTGLLKGHPPRRDRARRRGLIRALTRLRYAPAVPQIAALLPCNQLADHHVVVEFLMAAPAPAAIPYVLAAIPKIRRPSEIMDCVRVLQRTAEGYSEVAVALLPFLNGEKLDQMQVAELCKALGTIAPKHHEPTIAALRQAVDTGRTGDLELEAAISLGRLGDKVGPQRLLKTLKAKVQGRYKRDYLQHNNLGDYYLAFGDYQRAVRSYENAIRHTSMLSYQSRLYIKIARAEACRERWALVRRALKASKANYQQLMKDAQDYPELRHAYEQETVHKYLESIRPKTGPKVDGEGNGKAGSSGLRRE